MNTSGLKFKTFQIIIDNHEPLKSDIDKIPIAGKTFEKNYGADWYKIEKVKISDRFLWIYVEYENSKKYNSKILNGDTGVEEANPRDKNKVELKHQFFVCYDCKLNLLYITKDTKKGFIKHYFEDALQKEIIIKNVYTTLEEFKQSIKTIESVRFTQLRNLQNSDPNSMFTRATNILGFGAAEKLSIKVDYGIQMCENVLERLNILKNSRDRGEFEKIVIIGKDDNNIEQTFDFSSKISNFILNVNKTENDRYENDIVKQKFLDYFREEN